MYIEIAFMKAVAIIANIASERIKTKKNCAHKIERV